MKAALKVVSLYILFVTAGRAEIVPDHEKLLPLIVEKLDLSTFRNSLGPRREAGMRFFREFIHQKPSIRDGEIVYDLEDWFYKVKIVRVADVTGDGITDAVILFEDRSKIGSYNTSNLYVITQFSEGSNLIALAYDVK